MISGTAVNARQQVSLLLSPGGTSQALSLLREHQTKYLIVMSLALFQAHLQMDLKGAFFSPA